jgi:hypothetical protein
MKLALLGVCDPLPRGLGGRGQTFPMANTFFSHGVMPLLVELTGKGPR